MIPFLGLLSIAMTIVGIIGIIKGSLKTLRIYSRKGAAWFTLSMFGLFLLLVFVDSGNTNLSVTKDVDQKPVSEAQASSTETAPQSPDKQSGKEKTADSPPLPKDVLNFQGDMTLSVKGKNIVANIHSNVPDGGLFEVAILSGQLNLKSAVLPIKNGEIIYEIPVPNDWEPSYYAGMAIFRFNAENIKQPDHIKAIYGEHGEKMTGPQAQENNLGGKNGIIQSHPIAFPDEETVKKSQADKVHKALAEAVKNSDGLILDIQTPEWSTIYVVVSDAWYYMPQYQKERFAQSIGPSIENLIVNAGLADIVTVSFVDSFGTTVAYKGFLGDYKVKK